MAFLTLQYPGKQLYHNQVHILTREQTKYQPKFGIGKADLGTYYSLILDDPDASEDLADYLHWILMDLNPLDMDSGKEILAYMGPDQPHRYRATLYRQPHKIDIALFNSIKRDGYQLDQLLSLLFLRPEDQIDQIVFIVAPD